jgi:hypothetical protein
VRKCARLGIGLFVALVMVPVSIVGAASAPSEKGDDNLDIAILADESRSLSAGDVAAVRSAVARIVNSALLFDRNIRFSIIPFSSGADSPRRLKGCESIPLTKETSSLLVACSEQIVRQTQPGNSNTDFAAAIKVATQRLGAPENGGRLHALILLTDGQYDPDGDERTSPAEKRTLDAALAQARESLISIWGLGFGKANLQALASYSSAGAQVPSQCASTSQSAIVPVEELNWQMQLLVASLTCTDPPRPPEPTPYDLEVNPLLSEISLSVESSSDSDPTVTDGVGKDPCKGFWKYQGTTFNCYLSLDGSNAGTWTVRTETKGTLSYQFRGELAGTLSNCGTVPTLHVGRLDENPVDWNSTFKWPSLKGYLVGPGGKTLQPTLDALVDSEQIAILVPQNLPVAPTRLEFELPRESEDSLIYSMSRVSCDLVETPETSTSVAIPATAVQNSSVSTTVPTEVDSSSQAGSHAWMWILVVLAFSGLGVIAYRVRRSRRFPDGTVVMQESPDKPGTFVELDGEVSGRRRVSLRKSGGRFLALEPYGDGADIVLTRSGMEVRVDYPTGDFSDDGEAILEHAVTPFGIALRVQGFVIRVDIPDGLEDDF